ncbi:hypothetical protein A0H81_13394 [Grifola frondosa]|uniref:Uncharacterized protein n=1 Tax=Grifola frondosa TaxID=5627 RepID=A0A1C7LPJ8_GRIFR|nr:hypothetical protein A0H81_13394 [Grifola frondosa]
MRLLHTKRITFEEFQDISSTPPHAILSHLWREDEVSLHHVQQRQDAKRLPGYHKILNCCAVAHLEGYDWVWVDTCCIDKTSSSEVSEAINSMYAWYNKSQVCYAYLDDVPRDLDHGRMETNLRNSEWFTRGWTLQELIAPVHVVFLAHDWSEIGTRAELADVIANFTGIDSDLLKGRPVRVSIARRMSWAAHRRTTKEEDRAYSLMGLFGIHMPTIYGEGKRAFLRLQHEIIKRSTDHSIFAWGYGEGWDFLACDPSSFSNWISDPISLIPYETFAQIFAIEHPEHSLTNHGIRIRLPMRADHTEEGKYEAALACWKWDDRGSMLGCYLTLSRIEGAVNRYRRESLTFKQYSHDNTQQFKARDIYLEHKDYLLAETLDIRKDPDTCARVFLVDIGERRFEVMETTPQRMWRTESETKLYFTADGWFESRICGAAVIREKTTGRRLAMVLGLDGSQERRSPPKLVMDILPEDDTEIWRSPTDEIARTICQIHQASSVTHGKFLSHEDSMKQFFQRSKPLGAGLVHITIDVPPHRGVHEPLVNTVELHVDYAPHLTGLELERFLSSVVRFILQQDTSSIVEKRLLKFNEFQWDEDTASAVRALARGRRTRRNGGQPIHGGHILGR